MFSGEYRFKAEKNLQFCNYIDYVPKNEKYPFSFAVTHERHSQVWPLTERDLALCTGILYDQKNKRYIVIKKSCLHERAPKISKCVRATTFVGMSFEETSDNTCTVTEVSYIDMGGKYPRKIMKSSVSQNCEETYKQYSKILQEHEKAETYPSFGDVYRIIETISDNSRIEWAESWRK